MKRLLSVGLIVGALWATTGTAEARHHGRGRAVIERLRDRDRGGPLRIVKGVLGRLIHRR